MKECEFVLSYQAKSFELWTSSERDVGEIF